MKTSEMKKVWSSWVGERWADMFDKFSRVDFGFVGEGTDARTMKAFKEMSKFKMAGSEKTYSTRRKNETWNTFKAADGTTVKTVEYYAKA